MTVTAPPRPPRPSDPVTHGEFDALVEALIEEARQRGQRRRRRNGLIVTLVALVGVGLFGVLGRSAESQTASPAASARMNAAAQAPTPRLAFISNPGVRADPPIPGPVELYVVNADGSGKRLVARNRSLGGVAWSPDGRTIAYLNNTGRPDRPRNVLFLVNADGSGKRNLTREWGLRQMPIWSPDGRRIAFTRCREGRINRLPNCDIYVMNADGSGARRFTDGWGPSWSPNGSRIAFSRVRYSIPKYPSGRPEVWVMNTDGAGQRRLALGFPSSWSPDGKKIAITGGDRSEIYVMNADGSGQRPLITANFVSATWSPDGRKILFTRYQPTTPRHRLTDIYVMNTDGSGQRKLTERGAHPAWSPDSKRISFMSSRDGDYEIYVMNADGSGLANVSQNPLRTDRGHYWAPAPR